ncbi:MAG: DinB family protein [Anaerolineales bacterium]|nr:DinB family protein [Anaerolineales bacterium]
MSELPFDIPHDVAGIRKLFIETRDKLSASWEGLSEELMIQRPGPHPEWSVKDIVAHICWWETFAISRIAVIAAGLQITSIEDFDTLNRQVDEIISSLPLDAVMAQFEAHQDEFLNLIDHFSYEEWVDKTRPNFEGMSLMFLLGANTFGHYYEHLPDLIAYKEKYLS